MRVYCKLTYGSNPLRFGLFLRLFLIMGVTWSSEIISYIVGSDKKWSKIFYVSDLCNAMQGFLIFMLFVLKKKVKHLISNRYVSATLPRALLVLSPSPPPV